MTHVNVTILAVGDEPPIKDDPPPRIGNLEHFFIMEKGTVNGKTSVAFLIESGGQKILVQTTSGLMNLMARAMYGAMQRFGDDFLA